MLMPAFRRNLFLVLLLFAVSPGVQATAIHYETEDLADIAPGQDLWQYRYDISGLPSPAAGFDVYFRLGDGFLPGDLSNPASPNGDWNVLVVQPDPGIPADGFFDVARLVASPRLVFGTSATVAPAARTIGIDRPVVSRFREN